MRPFRSSRRCTVAVLDEPPERLLGFALVRGWMQHKLGQQFSHRARVFVPGGNGNVGTHRAEVAVFFNEPIQLGQNRLAISAFGQGRHQGRGVGDAAQVFIRQN